MEKVLRILNKNTTIQKNTIKIGIGLGSIALRLDEAKCVNVEAIHA